MPVPRWARQAPLVASRRSRTGGAHSDPYARTAGLTDRGEDFDYQPHAKALDRASVLADARVAKERLAERSSDPVFTLGFCRFGAESWALSATDLGAAGCMGFYGRPGGVLDLVPSMTSPVLVLAAGADAATTPAENAAFAGALSDAGVDYVFVEYEGAPHSFFDRSFGQWEDACTDATGCPRVSRAGVDLVELLAVDPHVHEFSGLHELDLRPAFRQLEDMPR